MLRFPATTIVLASLLAGCSPSADPRVPSSAIADYRSHPVREIIPDAAPLDATQRIADTEEFEFRFQKTGEGVLRDDLRVSGDAVCRLSLVADDGARRDCEYEIEPGRLNELRTLLDESGFLALPYEYRAAIDDGLHVRLAVTTERYVKSVTLNNHFPDALLPLLEFVETRLIDRDACGND